MPLDAGKATDWRSTPGEGSMFSKWTWMFRSMLGRQEVRCMSRERLDYALDGNSEYKNWQQEKMAENFPSWSVCSPVMKLKGPGKKGNNKSAAC